MHTLKCERCGSTEVVPIVRGIPRAEMYELARQRRVRLDGDHPSDVHALWICLDCDSVTGDSMSTEQKQAHEKEVDHLLATVQPASEYYHQAMAGRMLIRRMLRTLVEVDAQHVEIRVAQGHGVLRCAMGNAWQTMDSITDSDLRFVITYLRWEQTQQSRRPITDTYQVGARVGTEEREFAVHVAKSEEKETFTISLERTA